MARVVGVHSRRQPGNVRTDDSEHTTVYRRTDRQLDGELVSRDQATADTTLLLTSGKYLFTAILAQKLSGQATKAWKKGGILRVTGSA